MATGITLSTESIPEYIAYPDASVKGRNHILYTGHDRLIQAIKRLDVTLAVKLIQSGQFDLNQRDYAHFGGTELNKICSAANSKYNAHKNKLTQIMMALLRMDDIELNTVNDFGRSPLGNAIRKNRRYFCRILLFFGCGLNEDAIKSIIQQMDAGDVWMFDLMKEVREEYAKSLKEILRANEVECVMNVILDFIVPPNESRQIIQNGIDDLERWLLKEFKSKNMRNTFVNVGAVTMNGFELTYEKLEKMNLDKGIKRKLLKTMNCDGPRSKKRKIDQIDGDVYAVTECDWNV